MLVPTDAFAGKDSQVGRTSAEALEGQYSSFDLGHVEPTAVLGGVLNLQLVN